MKKLPLLCWAFLLFAFPSLMSGQQYFGVNNATYENWAVGVNVGTAWIRGDITPQHPGYQVGIYILRSIQRPIDVRISVNGAQVFGQDVTPTDGNLFNPVLNGSSDSTFRYDSTSRFFQNYKSTLIDGSIEFKFNLNRLFSNTGGDLWDLYVLGGAGVLLSYTVMDAYDNVADGIYDFSTIPTEDPAQAREFLNQMLDGTYETLAERDFINSSFVGRYVLNTQFTLGFGGRYKLTEELGIGLEGRYMFVGSDLLDGQQWKGASINDPGSFNSFDNDGIFRAGLTLDYTF